MNIETLTNDDLNMDSFSPDELDDLIFVIDCNPLKLASQFETTIRGLNILKRYCENKSSAMKNRILGEIPTALFFESICDDIFKELPEELKW